MSTVEPSLIIGSGTTTTSPTIALPSNQFRSIGILRTFWLNRDLIQQLVKRETAGRYKGTVLGALWSLANPLFMLAVYTFAFAYVLKISPHGAVTTTRDIADFALIVFSGMILFGVLNETLNRAVVCIPQNANYVKKIIFPLEIFPFVLLGAALIQAAMATTILEIANLLLHGFVPMTLLLAPLTVIPLLLMILGFSWTLASIGVYLRDLSHIVAIVTMAMIYVSPVFYSMDTVSQRSPLLAALIRLNPLTIPLENFRAAALGTTLGGPFAPIQWTILHALASIIIATAGFAFFQRTKRGFADVV